MKVTIFGLGIIGEAWAKNLLADKVDLAVWNRTKKEWPHFVADAAEAARLAQVCLIVVSDGAAVRGVMEKILPSLRAGKVVVQCSTITPQVNREMAAAVGQTGAAFLEAPFTGSKPAAEKRETVFYVGGESAVLEKVRPILQRLARAILPIGPLGSASALKLAMNLNVAEVGQALCESLALARSAGIPDDVYFNALKLNVSYSGLANLKEQKLRSGNFAPQFSLKLMLKDLRQTREIVGARPAPQLDRLIEVYEQGMACGWAEDDFMGLLRLLEK